MTEVPQNPEHKDDDNQPANAQELSDLRSAISTKMVPQMYPGNDVEAQEALGWHTSYIQHDEEGILLVSLETPVPGVDDDFPMPTQISLDRRLRTLENGHEIWDITTYELPDPVKNFGQPNLFVRQINEVIVKEVDGKKQRTPVKSDTRVKLAAATKTEDWAAVSEIYRQAQADAQMDEQIGGSGQITKKQYRELMTLLDSLTEEDRRTLEE